jgi:hypothetical protein
LKPVTITRVKPASYIHDAAFDPVVSVLMTTLHSKVPRVQTLVNKFNPEGLNIVVGAHLLQDPKMLLDEPNTIVYNFEQFDTKSDWFSSDYVSLLKSKPYWDYSTANIAAMKKAYPEAQATHVPFAYAPVLDYSYVRRDVFRVKRKDIDVLFFGSMNDRRAKIIGELTSMGLNVQAVFGVYGPELSVLIHRSKLVLNMHYYESSVFEAVRVIPLLASRVAVVSEKSVDDDDYRYLNQTSGILVTDYDKLAFVCKQLVENADDRECLSDTGYANVKLKTMVQSLENVGGIL